MANSMKLRFGIYLKMHVSSSNTHATVNGL